LQEEDQIEKMAKEHSANRSVFGCNSICGILEGKPWQDSCLMWLHPWHFSRHDNAYSLSFQAVRIYIDRKDQRYSDPNNFIFSDDHKLVSNCK